MYSLDSIQDAILAYLDGQFVQPVIEQAIPDSQTVLRNRSGNIDPYIAVQFGDPQARGARAMAGPTGDDYSLPIYTQVIAPDPSVARKMSNKMNRVFLGETFPCAGSVRKRAGGNMFPIVTSTGANEAYQFPASFGLLIQLSLDA